MRSHSANLILIVAMLLTVFGIECRNSGVQAADNLMGKSPDAAVRSSKDNSGRQLAVASVIPVEQKPVAKGKPVGTKPKSPGVNQMLGDMRDQLDGHLKTLNIDMQVPEVEVPAHMEKTYNSCFNTCKTAFSFAREHTNEFSTWMGRYLKQLTSPPLMTPCRSPYFSDDRVIPPGVGLKHSKMFFTHDGRLKTVVNR